MLKTSGSLRVGACDGDPAQAGGHSLEGEEVSTNHGGDPACKGCVLCVLVGVLIKAVMTAIARARAAKGAADGGRSGGSEPGARGSRHRLVLPRRS
jgi:hypothetical protein